MRIMRLNNYYGPLLVLLTVIVREQTATNLFNMVDQGISTTKNFMKVMKLYNEHEEYYKAKVLIKIINLTKGTLSGGKHQVESGLNSQLPVNIARGSKDAIALYQNEPLQGVDATYSYTVFEKVRLFIYVKVGQKIAGRGENNLGICLARGDNVFDDQWFNDMLVGNKSCLSLNVKVKSNPSTLQCCIDVHELCAQASMTSSHQATVEVHLYPRNITDFWERPKEVTQKDLDNILSIPNTCFINNALTNSISLIILCMSIMFYIVL